MNMISDLATTESAYDPVKARQMAKEAGVSKDLLKQLVLQKKMNEESAANRQGIMGAPLPQGTIAEQNAQKMAQRVGATMQQQEAQRQQNLQQMANRGIAGAPSMRAMPGGIANVPQVMAMKRGGMVRGYQEGGTVGELERALRMEGINDPELIKLAATIYMQESSGGKNAATSVDGARGPMQVMPNTFRGIAPDLDPTKRLDQVRAGVRYLKEGYEATGGDPYMAAAYYHGGPSAPGRIAETGQGLSDGLGKNTADYAQDIVGRMPEQASGIEQVPLRPEPTPLLKQGPPTEVAGYAGPTPGQAGFEPVASAAPVTAESEFDGRAQLLERHNEHTPFVNRTGSTGARRAGEFVRDAVTYPFNMAADRMGIAGQRVVPPLKDFAEGITGANLFSDPEPTDTGITAEQYMDITAGSQAQPQPTEPPPPPPPAEEPTGVEKYFADRLAEQNDPRRRRNERLAAWASAQGGFNNLGAMGRAGVAASQAFNSADNAAIDANLNAELNRRTEKEIWNAREQGDREQAMIAAQAQLEALGANMSQDRFERAYKFFTEGDGTQMLRQIQQNIMKDEKNADPRQISSVMNRVLGQLIADRIAAENDMYSGLPQEVESATILQ